MGVRSWAQLIRSGPDRNTGLGHKLFGFGDGIFAEVEDRRRQHRRGVAVANAFDHMMQGADPARGDHRNFNLVRNRAGQLNVEPGAGA